MLIPEIQRIVCAANTYNYNGEVLIVPGPRHLDQTMRKLVKTLGLGLKEEIEQGFIDQWGNFLNRKEALEVAKRQGQCIRSIGYEPNQLYSEMLY